MQLRVDRPRRLRRQARARPRAPPARRRGSARPSRSAAGSRAAGRARSPSSVSKIDSNARVSRRCRWKPSAKRCASSRIALQQLQPGIVAVEHGSAADGPGTNTSSSRFASAITATRGRSQRLHRLERRRELPLAAVDHDEVRRRGEALVVAAGRRRVAQPREAARDHLRHRREVVLPVEAAHRELAVVRLLRQRVLEDDHRARRSSRPWMFEMSKHSIRSGRLSRLSASRSSSSASTRRSRFCSRRGRLVLEREPRVLVGELREPPLLAALRARAPRRARRAARRGTPRAPPCRSTSGGTTICGGTLGAAP